VLVIERGTPILLRQEETTRSTNGVTTEDSILKSILDHQHTNEMMMKNDIAVSTL